MSNKAWITDLWVKDATINGHKVPPTPAMLRKLKSLPIEYRRRDFGKGARWQVGWRTPDGKRSYKRFQRRAEAEAYVTTLENDLRRGRYIPEEHGKQLFSELADVWLQSKTRLKSASVYRYKRDLDRYVLPRWGNTPINAITRGAIEAWVHDLMNGTAPTANDNPTPLSPSSISGIVRIAFGAPLRYAVAEQWLPVDPLARVELPRRESSHEMMYLTHHEVEELAAATDDQHGTLIRLLAYTGLRIGEALALTPADWDATACRITVRQTWTIDTQNKPVLGPPKTWRKRVVPVPSFLVEALNQCAHGDWLFKAPRGGPILQVNFRQRVWRKACDAAGIEGLRIHDLRHTAASISIAAGADVKLIQRMLGHRDASETLNIYGHLWPDRLDEVAAVVEMHRRRELFGAA